MSQIQAAKPDWLFGVSEVFLPKESMCRRLLKSLSGETQERRIFSLIGIQSGSIYHHSQHGLVIEISQSAGLRISKLNHPFPKGTRFRKLGSDFTDVQKKCVMGLWDCLEKISNVENDVIDILFETIFAETKDEPKQKAA